MSELSSMPTVQKRVLFNNVLRLLERLAAQQGCSLKPADQRRALALRGLISCEMDFICTYSSELAARVLEEVAELIELARQAEPHCETFH